MRSDCHRRRRFLAGAGRPPRPLAAGRTWTSAFAQPRPAPRPRLDARVHVRRQLHQRRARPWRGISVYRRARGSATWSQVQVLKDLADPSFLIVDRQGRHLYSAHGDGTQATSYQIDQATGRLDACSISSRPAAATASTSRLMRPDRFLALANYATGSLAVLPINAGRLAWAAHRPGHVRRPAGPAPDAAGELASAPLSLRPHRPLHRRAGQGARQGLHVYRLDSARGKLDAGHPAEVATRIGRGAASRRLPPDAAVRLRDQRARLDDRHVSRSIRRTACSSRLQVITTLPPTIPATTPARRSRWRRRGGLSTDRTAGTTASPSSRSTRRQATLTPGRLGIDPGADAALLRARSLGVRALRREPDQRHGGDLPGEPGRPAS